VRVVSPCAAGCCLSSTWHALISQGRTSPLHGDGMLHVLCIRRCAYAHGIRNRPARTAAASGGRAGRLDLLHTVDIAGAVRAFCDAITQGGASCMQRLNVLRPRSLRLVTGTPRISRGPMIEPAGETRKRMAASDCSMESPTARRPSWVSERSPRSSDNHARSLQPTKINVTSRATMLLRWPVRSVWLHGAALAHEIPQTAVHVCHWLVAAWQRAVLLAA
jgi:hypothetical protein